MPNHAATCDIPALPRLVSNAKANYSTAAIIGLGHKYNVVPFPTAPTVGKLISQKQLVKHSIAQSIVRALTLEIAANGGHTCAHCTAVVGYNTRVKALGNFIQHLASLREYSRDDVLGRIATHAGYSPELVGEMAKKRTVPVFVAQNIINACNAQFGQHAASWRLGYDTIAPHECQPVSLKMGRSQIAGIYNEECSKRGC